MNPYSCFHEKLMGVLTEGGEEIAKQCSACLELRQIKCKSCGMFTQDMASHAIDHHSVCFVKVGSKTTECGKSAVKMDAARWHTDAAKISCPTCKRKSRRGDK